MLCGTSRSLTLCVFSFWVGQMLAEFAFLHLCSAACCATALHCLSQQCNYRGKVENLNQYNIHELVRGSETIAQKDTLRDCASQGLQLDARIHRLKALLKQE